MTFSLVARCRDSGCFGVAIASSSPAVAARCAYTRAGTGAVASQNVTDPTLGPLALDLLQEGRSAAQTIATVRERGRFIDYRQVLVVDADGRTAVHSGANALGLWADARGTDVAAAGNLLADEGVPDAIVRGFEATEGQHLGERLVAALRAGLAAGGEAGPIHSAGLQIAGRVPWPVADLRCDWTDACPVEALAAIWAVYAPQLDAYVQRALDPREAPSYGVPGDDG